MVREATDGHGADVILDNMGAKYLARNVDALATEGRLVVIGMQGGTKAELDLGALLRKRGAVIATALRARPVEEKAAICASVVEHVWPLVAEGRVRPIVHTTLPLDEVARRARADGVEREHRQDPASPPGPARPRVRPRPRVGPHERAGSAEAHDENAGGDEQQVVVIGPDGQPMGVGPGQRARRGRRSDGERRRRRGRRARHHRPGRAAGQGDADRQHDPAAARGGEGRARSTRPAATGSRRSTRPRSRSSRPGWPPSWSRSWSGSRCRSPRTATPSEGELRIAQAQLVGWLEGLFHGIQTAIYAQQMAARAQLEQMRAGAAARRGDARRPEPAGASPARGRSAAARRAPAGCTSSGPSARGGTAGRTSDQARAGRRSPARRRGRPAGSRLSRLGVGDRGERRCLGLRRPAAADQAARAEQPLDLADERSRSRASVPPHRLVVNEAPSTVTKKT